MGDRWRADPYMNLLGASVPKHLINLSAGGRPNDGIIHSNDLFTFQQFFYWIQFDLDAEMADSLLRLDECPSYIMISYHPELQRDFRFRRIAQRGRESGIRDGDNHIYIHRRFPGELDSK